ncbi:MAG TPA: SMC-Scp complex subunit ScpB [Actinobacteria bacterium]|nr:SMC-Scp complex subunit ScpB [Actinomycetota bacterium]HCK78452.1 SMC-Scp complex subunit ScpB [Actinomycetota bacterium]
MVVDEPVEEVLLAQVTERPIAEVSAALTSLAQEYADAGRGFDLRNIAGGWRFYSRAEFAPWVERFVLEGQTAKLTQAALETLAVVAYRQPITRARISAIRGVNVESVLRTLVSRELVAETGQEEATGAILYTTTPYFLERMGLSSLEQLPEIAPHLPELSALESEIGGSVD